MIPIRVRCGLLVYEAKLGRETERVPDPLNPGHLDLEVTPYPVKTLLDENFRAVKSSPVTVFPQPSAQTESCAYGDPSR